MTDPTSIEVSSGSWLVTGRAAARTPIARGSAWILASTLISAVGGALFWLAAARTATEAEVGFATALFSSVAFVNYVTGLGLPIMVARYGGAKTPEARTLFTWAMAATAVSSAVVTAVYLPLSRGRADPLYGSGVVAGAVFFAAVAAGNAVSQLVDMRLTVQRRWSWVTARVTAYSILRFPLLLIGAQHSVFLLFALSAGLPAASGFVTWWIADPRRGRFRLRPLPSTARVALRYSGVSYLSQLAVQAPVFVLPVLVLLVVPITQNAAFFIAWTIAMTVYLLPINVVKVLLAEGAHARDAGHQTRIALGVNAAIGVVALAVSVAGADLLTTIYGSGYARAADLLPLLVAAVLPWGLTLVALTHARIIDDERTILLLSILYAVSVLLPSVALVKRGGTFGAAQGWFAGNLLTAVVAGVWLARTFRRERDVDQIPMQFPSR